MPSNEVISRLTCSDISFPPNYSIFPNIGFYFWAPKRISEERFRNAIWLNENFMDDAKEFLSKRVSLEYIVFTENERLGNLFVSSMICRCLSIITSSAKLYVDNSKLSHNWKFALSTTLCILPSLFMIYSVGYSTSDLIFNTLISQTTYYALSYISLSCSNYLRSLELISDDKDFNFKSYLSKIAISGGIEFALSLFWHGKNVYFTPDHRHDLYHTVKICLIFSANYSIVDIMNIVLPVPPLIAITDKLVWAAGKVAMDAFIIAAHNYGFKFAKDLRSPFINSLESTRVEKKLHHEVSFDRKHKKINSKVHRQFSRNQPEKDYFEESESKVNQDSSSIDNTSLLQNIKNRHVENENHEIRKEKVKTRKQTSEINSDLSQPQPLSYSTKIEINDRNFYKIEGHGLSNNTWATLNIKEKKHNKDKLGLFESILENGARIINASSVLKILQYPILEIRPKSIGDRCIGAIISGKEALSNNFLLGEAMRTHDILVQQGNGVSPAIAVFDEIVSHENISKAVHKKLNSLEKTKFHLK